MKINPIVVVLWGCLAFAGMGVQSAGAGSLSGVRKILYLGNSITLHAPKPDINWSNNWGMAASAEAKDYVHLVTAAVAAQAGATPAIMVENIAGFERDYATFDVETEFADEFAFKPDLFVLAIGENVTLSDAAQFKAGVLRIINGVKAQNSDAIIVVRSCFWADAAKDQALREASQQAGAIFVNIGALGGVAANYAYSEPPFNDPAFSVFNTHPGDTGMAAIANAIVQAVVGHSGGDTPVTDNNVFRGKPVVASSVWQWSADFPVANATDGTGNDFVFEQGHDNDQRLVIHGFNSRLRLIRLWTDLDLNPTALTVRSSSSDTNSLDGADYETLLVPTTTSLHAKGTWRSAPEGYYVDLLVQAPEGTRSVWLDFGSGNGNGDWNTGWARIREVQGFSALFAPLVTDNNLFPGKHAVASSVWSDGTQFPVAQVIDGKVNDFVFAVGDTNQCLVIRGFNSGLRVIRLWSDWDLPPTQVTIRSSTNDNSSLAGDDYETPLVSTLAVPNALPPWTLASAGYYMNFFVQAPAGTRSVWFDFGSGNGYGPTEVGWARIREVQGFSAAPSVADANLFSGKPVAASSEFPTHEMVNATDGESGGAGKDFVFASDDASQRLVVHGFYGAVCLVRLWAGDLRPRRITLKSSTTDQTSLYAADYETTLLRGPVSLDGRWMASADGASYVEIAVSAPKGTKSLFADFGSGNDTVPGMLGFARITEIQAFKVPGPTTVLALW